MDFAHLNVVRRDEDAGRGTVPAAQADAPPGPPGERPGSAGAGGRGRSGNVEPQLVFTNVLLSVVSAYGVTGSAAVTLGAAAIALLVTLVFARRR